MSALANWVKPNAKKTYIVPTRMGGYFITVTLIVLLVGSGYSNNLVNILAFFMLSLVFVGMVLTNLQLKDLTLLETEILPTFAEDELWAQGLLKNASLVERWGLRLEFPDLASEKIPATERVVHHLHPRQNNRVSWSQIAGQRGRHRIQRVQLSSVFPLGLFYAWRVIPVDLSYWVYPKLEGQFAMPNALPSIDAEAASKSMQTGGDDFRGHRAFTFGDSSRHIDWKAHARGRPLLVKEINEGDPPDRVFDYDSLRGLDHEKKLSQLAVWVKSAYEQDLSYVLRLPGMEDLSGRGEAQAKECFERLAVFS